MMKRVELLRLSEIVERDLSAPDINDTLTSLLKEIRGMHPHSLEMAAPSLLSALLRCLLQSSQPIRALSQKKKEGIVEMMEYLICDVLSDAFLRSNLDKLAMMYGRLCDIQLFSNTLHILLRLSQCFSRNSSVGSVGGGLNFEMVRSFLVQFFKYWEQRLSACVSCLDADYSRAQTEFSLLSGALINWDTKYFDLEEKKSALDGIMLAGVSCLSVSSQLLSPQRHFSLLADYFSQNSTSSALLKICQYRCDLVFVDFVLEEGYFDLVRVLCQFVDDASILSHLFDYFCDNFSVNLRLRRGGKEVAVESVAVLLKRGMIPFDRLLFQHDDSLLFALLDQSDSLLLRIDEMFLGRIVEKLLIRARLCQSCGSSSLRMELIPTIRLLSNTISKYGLWTRYFDNVMCVILRGLKVRYEDELARIVTEFVGKVQQADGKSVDWVGFENSSRPFTSYAVAEYIEREKRTRKSMLNTEEDQNQNEDTSIEPWIRLDTLKALVEELMNNHHYSASKKAIISLMQLVGSKSTHTIAWLQQNPALIHFIAENCTGLLYGNFDYLSRHRVPVQSKSARVNMERYGYLFHNDGHRLLLSSSRNRIGFENGR